MVYCSPGMFGGDMVRGAGTFAPVLQEYLELRLCGLEGDTLFQSRNDGEDVDPALPGHNRVKPERQPDLGMVIHDVGSGRHNADDLVAATLDFNHLGNERPPSKCG